MITTIINTTYNLWMKYLLHTHIAGVTIQACCVEHLSFFLEICTCPSEAIDTGFSMSGCFLVERISRSSELLEVRICKSKVKNLEKLSIIYSKQIDVNLVQSKISLRSVGYRCTLKSFWMKDSRLGILANAGEASWFCRIGTEKDSKNYHTTWWSRRTWSRSNSAPRLAKLQIIQAKVKHTLQVI